MARKAKVLSVSLVLALASVLVLNAVAAWLDHITTGGGAPSRMVSVVSADGATVIGHGFVQRSATSINIGRLQVVAPSPGRQITVPSWAEAVPPRGWTAVSSNGMGWPWRWLVQYGVVDHSTSPPVRRDLGWRVLPWRLGSLVAILSLMWFALSHVSRFLIHQRRIALGCCPRCSYSMAGLSASVCPECGERVRTTAGARAKRHHSRACARGS